MTILEIFDDLKKKIESNHSDVKLDLHQYPPHLGGMFCMVTIGTNTSQEGVQAFSIDASRKFVSLLMAIVQIELEIKLAKKIGKEKSALKPHNKPVGPVQQYIDSCARGDGSKLTPKVLANGVLFDAKMGVCFCPWDMLLQDKLSKEAIDEAIREVNEINAKNDS